MAQEVTLGRGGLGKVRSFGIGLLLTVVTFGLYFYFWYWFVNDEHYNCGQRIRRAQASVGVPEHERISPTLAFLLLVPGSVLLIPTLVHYWYVTRHQNIALRAAGDRERLRRQRVARARGLVDTQVAAWRVAVRSARQHARRVLMPAVSRSRSAAGRSACRG